MKSIVVFGDSLAEAIAMLLDRIAGISGQYRVVHLEAGSPAVPTPALGECAIFLNQEPYKLDRIAAQLPANCKRVAFPTLELRHLWPFACENPFNQPEPPRFPNGRFPYGDSFIVSCLEQHVSAERIVDYYLSVEWAASWPDLQVLELAELARLESLDARSDIGMASYVRANISKKRLFWNPTAPTNEVLCELIVRLLDRIFSPKTLITRRVLTELLHNFGDRDLFGAIGVPIHPHVARSFALTWYDPQERHPYYGELLSYREYFERMVHASVVQR